MAENKTKSTDEPIAVYLANIENDQKRADAAILMQICQKATGAEAKMWGTSMVGHGSYHYKYQSGREGDAFLAGFAARKANLVVYLVGEIPDQADLLQRLGKHKMGKACLYLKRLSDIDLSVLEELIAKSVVAQRARYPDKDAAQTTE